MCSAWFLSNKFISLCSIVKNSITTTTTTTTTAAICRVPVVVFVHRLVSEIETGGQGGRNINGNENQNWWYSKIPFPPSNNHINNLTKLSTEQQSSYWQSFIFEIAARRYVCKSCVNTFVKEYCKQSILDFLTYFQTNSWQKVFIEQQCEAFLDQDILDKPISRMNQPLIVVFSGYFGLASEIKVSCCCLSENDFQTRICKKQPQHRRQW